MAPKLKAVPLDGGIRPLSGTQYRQYRDLVHGEAGIFLSPVKKALIAGRLARRVRQLGMTSYGAYFDYATAKENPEEKVRLINAICTHETHFFREPKQFDLMERQLIPEWQAQAEAGRRQRHIRVWSAACSSGEEPYSLAMLLLTHFPPASGWSVEILATDLSTAVLDKARAGVWKRQKADEIPKRYLRRYMLKGVGDRKGEMAAGPEIRSVIRFAQLNLSSRSYSVSGAFDLILCRNVLIYFSSESRPAVIGRLLDRLVPGGCLFLGHAESLAKSMAGLRSMGPMAYRLTGPHRPEAARLQPALQVAGG